MGEKPLRVALRVRGRTELVEGQNSPSVSCFEQGRGVGRKETPSVSHFEQGRWLNDLCLAFRVREGMGLVGGKAPPLSLKTGVGGVVKRWQPLHLGNATGMSNPRVNVTGCPGVWVQVAKIVPQRNPYPSHRYEGFDQSSNSA